MDKIICLVGPSGSGKTTIAKELEKEGYNVIQSYTTRKPRCKDEWGHIFVSKNAINHVNEWDLMAIKELYGDYYWSTKEQYIGKGTSIYVVDPQGAEQVKETVQLSPVITVFLMADLSTRRQRIYKREIDKLTGCFISDEDRGVASIEADFRTFKDAKIFSKCKCDYVVDANRSLKKVIEDIKEIIKEGELE